MENKKLKVKDIVLFIIFLIFLKLEIYLIIAWIPVKSAVKESDFYKHGNFILVTENVGTGTPYKVSSTYVQKILYKNVQLF